MDTIPANTIIRKAAELYIEAFNARSVAGTITTAANLDGKMQAILDMVLACGLTVTDVMIETRRIFAEEAEK